MRGRACMCGVRALVLVCLIHAVKVLVKSVIAANKQVCICAGARACLVCARSCWCACLCDCWMRAPIGVVIRSQIKRLYFLVDLVCSTSPVNACL